MADGDAGRVVKTVVAMASHGDERIHQAMLVFVHYYKPSLEALVLNGEDKKQRLAQLRHVVRVSVPNVARSEGGSWRRSLGRQDCRG